MEDTDEYRDDEVFLSTQIQSRLDDLEAEQQQLKKSTLFHEYSHKSEEYAALPAVASAAPSGRRPGAAKTTVRRKKQCQTLSVRERMVQKLSGKPQKLRQAPIKKKKENKQKEVPRDHVFTASEWNSLKYRLRSISYDLDADAGSDDQELSALNIDDSTGLYDRSDRMYEDRYERSGSKYEVEEPITLSQFIRELRPEQPSADKEIWTPAETQTQTQMIDVVEIPDMEDYDDTSVVSNTTEEGSPIPTVYTVESSEEEIDVQSISYVMFKGKALSLRPDIATDMTIHRRTNEQLTINATDDDDDDDDYLIEIRRAF